MQVLCDFIYILLIHNLYLHVLPMKQIYSEKYFIPIKLLFVLSLIYYSTLEKFYIYWILCLVIM